MKKVNLKRTIINFSPKEIKFPLTYNNNNIYNIKMMFGESISRDYPLHLL